MNCHPSTHAPLVSIIIPCYKHAQFLPEAIDSALAQTYPNVEVIVVNDGSPDNTGEVCRRYGDRIRYIEQQNKGLAETRNVGIRVAKGEYILPLDADDKLESTFLVTTVPIIQDNPIIGYVYTNIRVFGASHGESGEVTVGDRSWNTARLLVTNYCIYSGIFRKEDWERAGGYCARFVHGAEDWDFWLCIVELGKTGHYVDAPLLLYRKHATGSMWSQLMVKHFAEAYALLIERHRPLYQRFWPELLVEWAARYQERFAYILKVEPIMEEYFRLRTGRLEKYGVPAPIARLLRQLRKRFGK